MRGGLGVTITARADVTESVSVSGADAPGEPGACDGVDEPAGPDGSDDASGSGAEGVDDGETVASAVAEPPGGGVGAVAWAAPPGTATAAMQVAANAAPLTNTLRTPDPFLKRSWCAHHIERPRSAPGQRRRR
ncbi:hypothetical protein GCM10022214_87500 [Actinomadura miaoliensis]|uniref:Uncharacterized protein n=1 Tax=Actinomadura miaoliensis TaxID=430685 RepID=A0ABP7X7Q2_9ACTN